MSIFSAYNMLILHNFELCIPQAFFWGMFCVCKSKIVEAMIFLLIVVVYIMKLLLEAFGSFSGYSGHYLVTLLG